MLLQPSDHGKDPRQDHCDFVKDASLCQEVQTCIALSKVAI